MPCPGPTFVEILIRWLHLPLLVFPRHTKLILTSFMLVLAMECPHIALLLHVDRVARKFV
jgi:hypothetical protein